MTNESVEINKLLKIYEIIDLFMHFSKIRRNEKMSMVFSAVLLRNYFMTTFVHHRRTHNSK